MVLSRDRARWRCSPTCPTRQRVPQQTPTDRVLVGTTSPNALGTYWGKHQPLTIEGEPKQHTARTISSRAGGTRLPPARCARPGRMPAPLKCSCRSRVVLAPVGAPYIRCRRTTNCPDSPYCLRCAGRCSPRTGGTTAFWSSSCFDACWYVLSTPLLTLCSWHRQLFLGDRVSAIGVTCSPPRLVE